MAAISTLLYTAAIRGRNALYDAGMLRERRLAGPVVSIGNVSVGGSGKTPFVMCLGELLKQRGIKFDVLSRGYGRRTAGVAVVDPAGTAVDFGDEPLLIARRLGVPMVVGESRYAAGLEAEKRFGPRLHLLDDGFQHRGLARDFDIVLVTAQDLLDRTLPWGRLREPLSSLRRADAIVVREETAIPNSIVQGKPVWRVRRGIDLKDAPSRPIVFSGIARPKFFLEELQEIGVQPAAEVIFRDHQKYGDAQINRLQQAKSVSMADGFITTEKDVLNLGTRIAELGMVAVARVTMELLDAQQALGMMLAKVQIPHTGIKAADVRKSE
jgi:tetraacyldisaccharide 4'-kinase